MALWLSPMGESCECPAPPTCVPITKDPTHSLCLVPFPGSHVPPRQPGGGLSYSSSHVLWDCARALITPPSPTTPTTQASPASFALVQSWKSWGGCAGLSRICWRNEVTAEDDGCDSTGRKRWKTNVTLPTSTARALAQSLRNKKCLSSWLPSKDFRELGKWECILSAVRCCNNTSTSLYL